MNKSTNYDYLTVFMQRQRCLGENVVVWWVFMYPVVMFVLEKTKVAPLM